MKQCEVCLHPISDTARFCEYCGAPVKKRAFLSEQHYLSWMEREDEPRTADETAEEQPEENYEVQPELEQNADSEGNESENQRESKPAQPKKSRLSGKKKRIALTVCAVLVILIAIAWRLRPAERFDQNLFENIPLTSAEEITTWLDDNGYEYEESGERGEYGWMVKFRSKQGNNEVSISDQVDHYTLCYRYGAGLRTYLESLMSDSHSLVSSDENESKYKDGENVYYVQEYDQNRILYRMYYGVTD